MPRSGFFSAWNALLENYYTDYLQADRPSAQAHEGPALSACSGQEGVRQPKAPEGRSLSTSEAYLS